MTRRPQQRSLEGELNCASMIAEPVVAWFWIWGAGVGRGVLVVLVVLSVFGYGGLGGGEGVACDNIVRGSNVSTV